ncbi:MAG TPA: hypothetical protein PK389_00040 [Gammaproteobacteria bacterium]|nr:hypothetical protein [Gammaproteobacteria bacterium]
MGSNPQPRRGLFVRKMERDKPSAHHRLDVQKRTPFAISTSLERSSELSEDLCQAFAKTAALQEEMICLMAVLSLRIIHSKGAKK